MIALDLRTRAYRQTIGKQSPNEAEAVSKDPKWKDIHDKLWYYSSGPGHEVAYGVTPYANTRPYIVAGNMRGALPRFRPADAAGAVAFPRGSSRTVSDDRGGSVKGRSPGGRKAGRTPAHEKPARGPKPMRQRAARMKRGALKMP